MHDLVARERGQILIATAVSMLAILGISALALDAGFMYDKRNRLYAVADAAAKSAAVELRRDTDGLTCGGVCSWTSPLSVFVRQQITANGYTPVSCGSSGGVSTCVNSFPLSGSYLGQKSFVEVVLSQQTSTFFGRVLGWTSMTPGARAVAGSAVSANCVVTLATTGDGFSFGGSTMTMPDCSIAVNANINNKGTITAKEITAHACSDGCTPPDATPSVVYPVPYVRDPLESLSAPSDPGCPTDFNPCTGVKTIPGGATTTLNPGKYGGWDIGPAATVQLNPGLYYITGPITGAKDVIINGTGVMIYLGPAATMDFDKSNFTVTLSAQTTGAYKGILFFQDRGSPLITVVFGKNDANLDLSGAMYFPRANLLPGKNKGGVTNDCTLFVAYTLDFKNSGTFSNACAAYGGSPIPTAALAE